MNKIITSREAILSASRELVQARGWSAVNIRTVAAKCDVSIGSIYNYFDSKAALISAVVEDVWHDIFRLPDKEKPFDSFTGCVEWIYERMKIGNEKYPGFFTLHALNFPDEEKSAAKQLMSRSWEHMQKELLLVLSSDKRVHPNAFNDRLTPEKFTKIIFSQILSSLLLQDYDCSGSLEMIGRIIY